MTTPAARPNPYIPRGDAWLWTVRVPSFGVWERDTEASQTWTAYRQPGRDYHITIDSAFLADHTVALDTHVSSNAVITGYRVHWPKPGTLSPPQQAWLNAHNTAQFTDLIAAFSARLKSCADNYEPSRDYDAFVAKRRQEQFAQAAQRRENKADYGTALLDWLDACPEEACLIAFREKSAFYFHDPDRKAVVRLEPLPQPVRSGEDPDLGFVNMCARLTAGKAIPANDPHLDALTNGITLLRVGDRQYAMPRSDFDACKPDGELVSLDRMAELAAQAWMKDVPSGAPYERTASSRSLMNVSGPTGAHYQLKTVDLLDAAELERLAAIKAGELAPAFHDGDLPNGVYRKASSAELAKKLPPAVLVRYDKTILYILRSQLTNGWVEKLVNVSTPDPFKLADMLPKYQIFAEELKIDDRADLFVYLWPMSGKGAALFVAPKKEFMPDASVGKQHTLPVSAELLGDFFGSCRLATGEAATGEAVIVICNNSGNTYNPPIFIDKSMLQDFDYDTAKAAYAPVKKDLDEISAMMKDLEVQSAVLDGFLYAEALSNILAQASTSNKPVIEFYKSRHNALKALSSEGGQPDRQDRWVDTLSVRYEDKTLPKRKKPHRCVDFFLKVGDKDVIAWVNGLLKHIEANKPAVPSGIEGVLFALR